MSQYVRQLVANARPVLTIGAKALTTPTKIITDVHAPEIQEAAREIIYITKTTMTDRLGVAANQLDGLHYNMFAARMPKFAPNIRYESIWDQNQKPFDWTIIINPVITPLTDQKTDGFEPCLSLPKVKALVSRWNSINCKYLDTNGEPQSIDLHGIGARLFQHEADHLKGILASEIAIQMVDEITEKPINYMPGQIELELYLLGEAAFNPDFFVGS
jgi:peptide deformylase